MYWGQWKINLILFGLIIPCCQSTKKGYCMSKSYFQLWVFLSFPYRPRFLLSFGVTYPSSSLFIHLFSCKANSKCGKHYCQTHVIWYSFDENPSLSWWHFVNVCVTTNMTLASIGMYFSLYASQRLYALRQ